MHCSTNYPATATIELASAVPMGDYVEVWITDGQFHRLCTCKPTALQSFSRFQVAAMQLCDVWIHHVSQDEPRAGRRRDEWSEAVRAAFRRGGQR